MHDFDPKLAIQYGEFIAIASKMRAPAEAPFTAPMLPAGWRYVARVIMTDSFQKKTSPEVCGFIAQRMNTPNKFVLALCGTETKAGWWDNLKSSAKISIAGLGKVAAGFEDIFRGMQVIGEDGNLAGRYGSADFTEQVASATKAHFPHARLLFETSPNDRSVIEVEVTGHGLGSALATLYVARNALSNRLLHTPTLYTFASPRVGDLAFARFFNKLPVTSWRIENPVDVVTKLPPLFSLFTGIFVHVDERKRARSALTVRADPLSWHDMNTYLHAINNAWPVSGSQAGG